MNVHCRELSLSHRGTFVQQLAETRGAGDVAELTSSLNAHELSLFELDFALQTRHGAEPKQLPGIKRVPSTHAMPV